MRLLLDTHIALWAVADDPNLSAGARDLIADPANDIAISAASLWEIGIKYALKRKGKSAMPISAATARGYFVAAGYTLLGVSAEHAVAVEGLAKHHADPFDRMLIAQALIEPRRLVTHDAKLAAYGAMVMKV